MLTPKIIISITLTPSQVNKIIKDDAEGTQEIVHMASRLRDSVRDIMKRHEAEMKSPAAPAIATIYQHD